MKLAHTIALTDKELIRIWNLSERTLHRLRLDALMDNNSSERRLLKNSLIHHGLNVFDHRADILERCFRTPLSELDGQLLFTLLDRTTGFAMGPDRAKGEDIHYLDSIGKPIIS